LLLFPDTPFEIATKILQLVNLRPLLTSANAQKTSADIVLIRKFKQLLDQHVSLEELLGILPSPSAAYRAEADLVFAGSLLGVRLCFMQ